MTTSPQGGGGMPARRHERELRILGTVRKESHHLTLRAEGCRL
jgi:hypothetical protein